MRLIQFILKLSMSLVLIAGLACAKKNESSPPPPSAPAAAPKKENKEPPPAEEPPPSPTPTAEAKIQPTQSSPGPVLFGPGTPVKGHPTVTEPEFKEISQHPVHPTTSHQPQVPNVRYECTAPYRTSNPAWAPGLTQAPRSEPIFNDFPNAAAEGRRFTDGFQDRLLKIVVDRANALPDYMQIPSRNFSKNINDIRISVDTRSSGEVKIQFDYAASSTDQATIELRGQLDRSKAHRRGADVKLVQVPLPGQSSTGKFAGVMTCADLDKGCKNIVMRLDRLNAQRKVVVSVFAIHRWGDAHLTLSDQDRKYFAKFPNPGHSDVTEYFSNTINNLCLKKLDDARAGRTSLSECELRRVQAECGNEDYRRSAAKSAGFRNWVIAYGRSGFELALDHRVYNGVGDTESRRSFPFRVSGPLIHSAEIPMFNSPLAFEGPKAIKEIFLNANDGGGHLNLLIRFHNEPLSQMGLGVSTTVPGVPFDSSIEENASHMPTLLTSDTASIERRAPQQPPPAK